MDHQKQITQQMDPSVYDVVKEEVPIEAESNTHDCDLNVCHQEQCSELVKEEAPELDIKSSDYHKLNHNKEKTYQ